ncbi:Nin one binding Zn-ribbon like-domain-containing protein [Thamnidium elegans]|uniref:20S-pre-rRNA D-site endonuclease NOB1 n=1 Tax=Thamnidium elegans TaxID=101142 RepID=A0A8H7VXB0_9FUNG|nr:hypothetical protein INT48_001156 [Thamnidium elegans]KAI8095471.1 Nin one binding Zn-ribbon like-domain-containing protein [Thamnidium elegans]
MSESPEIVSTETAVEQKQSPSSNILKCLVIDTNAIINGTSLRYMAEEFYTCPEVLYELRSAHSKEFLSRLPFELKIMNPSEEAMKTMIEFSKKTGDFGVLSTPDLKVLALTLTLELRENGDANVRKEPLKCRPSGSLPSAPPPMSYIKRPLLEKKYDEDGWEIATNQKRAPAKKYYTTPKKTKAPKAPVEKLAESVEKIDINSEEKTEPVAPATEETPVTKEAPVAEETVVAEEAPVAAAPQQPAGDVVPLTEDDDEDDEGGEWITPDNVDEYKAAEIGVTAAELRKKAVMAVGCMTADFAMQNVLLQMNLNLVSAGGYRVKKIRNSVMRCHACFQVTNDLEKKFCPKCGNSTLQRVTCSTNSKGEIAYHLKKNFQYRLRGSVYDIPPPKGGRKTNNIVLREDQRDYMKATERKTKKAVNDMFDPDFIPLYGKLDTKEVTNNMHGTETIGYGRKNPNSSKKRIGKKKRIHHF